MHEYSIVKSMVDSMLQSMEQQNASCATRVHFRRGSAFSEEALRQAYQALSVGTALENAEVKIDTVNLDFNCPCGHTQVINSDDLVGHMFICPNCGATKEIDEAHDLELVELVAEVDES